MTKRVAVLLSGCGGFDGSDLHEAVLTLLILERTGVEVLCTSPNETQHHVLNHVNQEEMDTSRNMLVESARIARGDIYDLTHLHADMMDAIIIPGGFGAAKNLSDFAFRGPDAKVHPQVEKLLKALLAAGKPIGAMGIAAAVVAKALASHEIEVTTGNDPGTASAIEAMGARHRTLHFNEVHVDVIHKIVTTPPYVPRTGKKSVTRGVELLVENILDLIG